MTANGRHNTNSSSNTAAVATPLGDSASSSMVLSESTVRQRGSGQPSAGSASTSASAGAAASTTSAPSPTTTRRRAYSWRGESPPYEKSKSDANNVYVANPSKLLPIIGQEARCILIWVVSSASIQVIVSILIRVSTYAYPLKTFSAREPLAKWWHEWLMVVPSVIAGCLLRIVPRQVVSNTAPGFIYASAWLLLAIKYKMGSLPHIPSRLCEFILGRLSMMECAVVVAVQFICTLSTVKVLRFLMVSNAISTKLVLSPIEYTNRAVGDGNPWLVDYFVELMVNTVFTVSLQVVPVLLKLNGCPQWLTLLFVYPLYTIGVDRAGQASTLSPSILFALGSATTTQKTFHALFRCIPQLLGGLLAGRIMLAYFPDENRPPTVNTDKRS